MPGKSSATQGPGVWKAIHYSDNTLVSGITGNSTVCYTVCSW